MNIAYLGPSGTFSEQAAVLASGLFAAGESKLLPIATIEHVFEFVADGRADMGVVPFENSIEGAVNATIDTLIFDFDLFISGQFSMPIIQNLMVRKNAGGEGITSIFSHQQSLAQCRKFLNSFYPSARLEAVSSNAEAAKIVSQGTNAAAIGPEKSAEIYGLDIIRRGIQDNKTNTTQFITITREDTSAPKHGCKASIAFSTENKPGGLYRILDIFALWDLNLTKITSRPNKYGQWEYVFFADVEGFKDLRDISDALTMIKRKTIFFKNLGFYKNFPLQN